MASSMHHPPRLHEAVRGVALDHLAVDAQVGRPAGGISSLVQPR
jgi:hypothetical protein